MPPPNLLFILTDQHHWHLTGYAGNSIVQTPNLDRLAERSVNFTSATCPSPLCTPSRMCMLTGKEAHRCSAWSNHWIIFPEHTTWPAHFSAQGYHSALLGKMHLGGKNQMAGFQHRPYGDLRHGLGHQPDPISLFPGYHGMSGAGVTEIPESLIQENVVTRESLAFILESASAEPDRPWFCCASYVRPHSPYTVPARYLRRYRGKVPLPELREDPNLEPYAAHLRRDLTDEQWTRGLEAYFACIDFVDDCIGELLNGLEAAGQLENTIVIYTSDHGEMMGNHGLEGKQLYFDDSVGVPLLISGPGIEGGRSVTQPASLIDLYPTTCSLAGLPIPEDLDGVDLSPLLKNPSSSEKPREYTSSACFRYGVKINYNTTSDDTPSAAWRCVRDDRWKYVEVEKGATLLFDTREDPLETRNLADAPEHQERCRIMREWLFTSFSWEDVHRQLEADRKRIPEHSSGVTPTTPNQYRLPDGRIFDAEKSLYDARWLPITEKFSGGIIPQEPG